MRKRASEQNLAVEIPNEDPYRSFRRSLIADQKGVVNLPSNRAASSTNIVMRADTANSKASKRSKHSRAGVEDY